MRSATRRFCATQHGHRPHMSEGSGLGGCVCACALAGRVLKRQARGEGPSWVRIVSRHRIAPCIAPSHAMDDTLWQGAEGPAGHGSQRRTSEPRTSSTRARSGGAQGKCTAVRAGKERSRMSETGSEKRVGIQRRNARGACRTQAGLRRAVANFMSRELICDTVGFKQV